MIWTKTFDGLPSVSASSTGLARENMGLQGTIDSETRNEREPTSD
jgi:hypothetical protein